MHFIIDGYNFIHAIPVFEKKLDTSLKSARDFLMHSCLLLKQKRGDIRSITVVFDGVSDYQDLDLPSYPGLKVVYTETKEDADDRIVEIMGHYESRTPCVIVSNDNYVLNNARAFGKSSMSAKDFYQMMLDGNRDKKRKENSSHKDSVMKHDQAKQITEEYKKILGID